MSETKIKKPMSLRQQLRWTAVAAAKQQLANGATEAEVFNDLSFSDEFSALFAGKDNEKSISGVLALAKVQLGRSYRAKGELLHQ